LLRQYARRQRCAPDEHPSALALIARDLADIGPRRATRLVRVMLDDAIEEKLPHGQCPALVIRGGRDRVAPAEWTQSVADLLANGTLITIPGYAHMAHYSGPLAVAPPIRAFLDEGLP
jgi:pimeloyl-ACP methyl ester carboxylesterase